VAEKGVEFDPFDQTNWSGSENCHVTEKSEAIPPCKEMPVILANKVVDKTRITGPWRRRGTRDR
jgi:hypothetical protein